MTDEKQPPFEGDAAFGDPAVRDAPDGARRRDATLVERISDSIDGRDGLDEHAALGGPARDGEDGMVAYEAARALAALKALQRCARFGRQHPRVAEQLSEALTRIDTALAEAVRELYDTPGDGEA